MCLSHHNTKQGTSDSVLRDLDIDTTADSFSTETVHNAFYLRMNSTFTHARGKDGSAVHDGLRINGVLLYHENTTLLYSTLYHCQSDNLTACPKALPGTSGAVPEVLAGVTQQSQRFLTDVAAHEQYTGLLAVPSSADDPTAPVYVFHAVTGPRRLGMVIFLQDLRLVQADMKPFSESCFSVWNVGAHNYPSDVAEKIEDAAELGVDMTVRRNTFDDIRDDFVDSYLSKNSLPESDRRVCEDSVMDGFNMKYVAHLSSLYTYIEPPHPGPRGEGGNTTERYGLEGTVMRFDIPRIVRSWNTEMSVNSGLEILTMFIVAEVVFCISLEFIVIQPLSKMQKQVRESVVSALESMEDDDDGNVERLANELLSENNMLKNKLDDLAAIKLLMERMAILRNEQLNGYLDQLERRKEENRRIENTLGIVRMFAGRDSEGISLMMPSLKEHADELRRKHSYEIKSLRHMLSIPAAVISFKHYCAVLGDDFVDSVMFIIDVEWMKAIEQGYHTRVDENLREYAEEEQSTPKGPLLPQPTEETEQKERRTFFKQTKSTTTIATTTGSPKTPPTEVLREKSSGRLLHLGTPRMPIASPLKRSVFKTTAGKNAARIIYQTYFGARNGHHIHKLVGVSQCQEYFELVQTRPAEWHKKMYDSVAAAVTKRLTVVFAEFSRTPAYDLLVVMMAASRGARPSSTASDALPLYTRQVWGCLKPKPSEEDDGALDESD